MKILQTYDGIEYEIDDETVKRIETESKLGKIGGIWISGEYVAFPAIKGIVDLKQNLNIYPQLPAVGMTGIITREKKLSALTSMAKGLQKVIDRRTRKGLESPNATELLNLARNRYKLAKKQYAQP